MVFYLQKKLCLHNRNQCNFPVQNCNQIIFVFHFTSLRYEGMHVFLPSILYTELTFTYIHTFTNLYIKTYLHTYGTYVCVFFAH